MYDEIRNKNILNDIIRFILFLAILFGGFWLVNNLFTKEVKALNMEIEPGVYLEMNYTEYEYFNNGVDVVMRLEVSAVTGNGRVINLLDYFTQAYDETSKFVFNLPHLYRLEWESPNGISPLPGFVKTLIIDRGDERMIAYDNNGSILINMGKSNLMSMGVTDIRLLRDSTTGMIDYQEAWNDGFDDGVIQGYDYGYGQGKGYYGYKDENDNWLTAQDWGNIEYQRGYQKGLDETDETGFNGLLTSILLGVGTVLGIELLPNITIGAIIAVPIVFGIISFVLGRRKGD